MNNKVVIIGAGPHSKVIIDILEKQGLYEIIGLIDHKDGEVLGYPIIGMDEDLEKIYSSGVTNAFVALGDNALRGKLYAKATQIGFSMVNAISIDSVISRYAKLGEGIAVMPGAVINASAFIGDGAIINTNASVDHDCRIGKFVHVAPGVAISGSCSIGNYTLVGTGARIIDRIDVGDNVKIGAGAVVIGNIDDNITAVGVPAKEISKKL